MMAAFGRIGTGEKVQPSQIADEISIALICTAMGLGTAIPFNFMLASLTTRIRRFQDALGAGLVRVLDVLKTASLSEDLPWTPRTSAWAARESTISRSRRPQQGAARVRHHGDGRPGVHDEHLLSGDVRHRGAGRGRSAGGQPRRTARRGHGGDADGRRRRRASRSPVYLGDGEKGEPIGDAAQQERAHSGRGRAGRGRGQDGRAAEGREESAARRLVPHGRRRPRPSKASS